MVESQPLDIQLLRQRATVHADRIERMFGRKGIDSLRRQHPDHPAIHQVETLRNFGSGEGPELFTATEFLAELAVMLIDQSSWPITSEDEPWAFLQSEKLRNEMARRLREPGSFGDTLTELYVWGQLRGRGFDVALADEPGIADLSIRQDGREVVADVKRIRLGSSPDAAGRALKKANDQIKKTAGDDAAGLVFISIERAAERTSLDDRPPSDVEPYLEKVRSQVSGQDNKSVAAAIILWDDVILRDIGGTTVYVFRRRSATIPHRNPRSQLAISPEELAVEAWFASGLRFPSVEFGDPRLPIPSQVSRGKIIAPTAFQQFNAIPEGVRPGHAIDALAHPDAVSAGPGGVVLATRHIAAARYTMLVIANDKAGEQQINAAFRLYPGDEPLPSPLSPDLALAMLLDRYGLPIKVGATVALLHPSAPAPRNSPLLEMPDHGDGMAHAVVRMGTNGPEELYCVFAIDMARYKADVRSRQS